MFWLCLIGKQIMIKALYELYVCKLNDEVLYVGQGASGRHKHCNSGSSHVYELNKLHFQGKTFDVSVVFQTNSKKQVLQKEKDLIDELKPKLNTVYNSDNKVTSGESKIKQFRKLLENKDPRLFRKFVCELLNAYDDMKILHKSLNYNTVFEPEQSKHYDKLGLIGMRRVAYNYHGVSTYGKYFIDCFNDVFKIN